MAGKTRQPQQEKARKPFKTAFIILLILFLSANAIAFFISIGGDGNNAFGNVALIPVKGTITGDSQPGLFSGEGASSSEIVEMLEDARDDPGIKAVILEINSPGGSAVASSEIAEAVKDLRAANKTVVAWIREAGASGAYWIASASDHIVAHPLSITGSIGVTSSYLDFSGLMQKYNVSYERLVAGEYKDSGSPYRKLTATEQEIFQQKLDIVHDAFIDEVMRNRNLTKKQAQDVSSGIFYLGSEAKQLGLVDELGGKDEAVAYVEGRLNMTAAITEYSTEKSLWETLNGVLNEKSFYVGKGMSSIVLGQRMEIRAE